MKLDQAIEHHLSQHAAQHYDLLRDDPEFAPWLGSALGSRGEKRLDRYIRQVKDRLAARAKRRAAPFARTWTPTSSHIEDAPDETGPFSDEAAAVLSYAELQDETRLTLGLLRTALEACVNAHGEIVNEQRFLKLLRAHRETITASANLARRFSADVRDPSVIDRVINRALQESSGDPARAHALIQDISEIVRETGGLAAVGASK